MSLKMPHKPPSIQSLLAKLGPDRALELLVSTTDPDDGRYLHWDDLRHRTPPAGRTHEEWWLTVKARRDRDRRVTPPTDRNGARFCFTLPDQILEQLHAIDSEARGQVRSEWEHVHWEHSDRYVIRSLMEEAITSSQLEGAATTHQVALDMLRTGRRPETRDERMIGNNFLAMKHIQAIKAEKLHPDHVLELHRILCDGTLDDPDAAGRLQTEEDDRVYVADNARQVVLHQPPPARELPQRLARLCAFANGAQSGPSFLHPVLRAIILHFGLAYDHPFADGNGRTARALFYWAMLHHGYWLMECVSISRLLKKAPAQYGRSFLLSETDDNDLTYFILYQLDIITRAITDLHRWLAHKAAELAKFQTAIAATRGLNHRQCALLIHAAKHPQQVYTIASHRQSNGVAYGTARSDLLQLAEENWLIQHTRGRRMEFLPGPKLRRVRDAL
jgi:Fic family protein